MSKVYPQDASAALDGVLRQDELASATQQSDLAAKQRIGTIGETIPLAFARRRNDIGGTWISPMIIQLGVKQQDISLLYVLSQGKVSAPEIGNVFYGYTSFTGITNGQICAGYQALPPCVQLDYNPGGSTSWETTVTYSGPGMPGPDRDSEFTTRTNTCVKLSIVLNGTCIISPPSGNYIVQNIHFPANTSEYGWPNLGKYDPAWRHSIYQWKVQGIPVTDLVSIGQVLANTNAVLNRSISISLRSEVRFSYAVTDVKTNTVVRTGQVWIPDGGTTLTIDGLPPAQYKVSFWERYSERTSGLAAFTPINYGNDTGQWQTIAPNGLNAWKHQNSLLAMNGGFRRNIAGSASESFSAGTVVETVRNTLNFPSVPGGDNQQQGGYTDLTLLGARGHYDALRPAEGPQHFTQIHAFLTEGVQVPKLLEGKAIGASDLYPDLVHYFMSMAGMLKSDQIDEEGLRLAALFNEKYKLRFNGVIATTVNFREWLARTAPYFLLSPRQINGRFGLAPVVPTLPDGTVDLSPVQPVATFTADDIVMGSYVKTWTPINDRKPFVAVMVFREQPLGSVGQSRTVEVRYSGMALSGPYEQHDLTEFCCTAEHAVYAARYILAKRRYVSHMVTFSAGRKAASLIPGDVIAIALTVETSSGEGVSDRTLYQVDQLSESSDGVIAVVATEFPVDGSGVSKVGYDTAKGDVVILQ